MDTGSSSLTLSCSGCPVARYTSHPLDAPRMSPRPFLHPVTTLAGTVVTEYRPADHSHHTGVSVAVPDVDGHNFWGGRTYVRGRGPTELDNHGTQHRESIERRGADGFVEELSWRAGAHELLREHRTVFAAQLSSSAWALDFTFLLTNPSARTVTLGSPATNGRPGAAYGGFFWRAPTEEEAPEVFTSDAVGERAAHGSPATWLALAGRRWTLVFAGATDETRRDPWFVRAAEYPGVGSSLASARRLAIEPGGSVARRVVTVVADGRLGPGPARALAVQAVST
ncbi:PmoA family protein [Streptomyces sp. ASQP_92]|uniref:DUF6807 domain-containing protein n=1 Tax=Streptomyces sp. ASQP_92 TaxID=2979116 RepID=UPI0021C0680E|nr:PmoA family protein [Streptomyces sp. ASQP_92]MCT9092529.1 PmoA family protein [Streptomyces sp. ASQP_92]